MPKFRSLRPRTAVLAVFAGSVALTACGDAPKSAGAGPYADLVAEYVPRIEQAMGLTFKTPPRVEQRSRDEVAAFVRKQLESERGRAQVAGQEAAYRLLGLIPDTMQLGALLQRLLEEQIVGYYDPATKVLYVVGGAPDALLKQTVSHELVHALQDQYVKIDSIQAQTDDGDRQVAAQAVLEGQAVYMQLRIDATAGPLLAAPDGWDRIRDMIREGSSGMPVFAASPRAVREGLLFPYLGGADFVRRFVGVRPEKELLTDLPVSTRQILSDSAYFGGGAGARDLPVRVTLPAPSIGTLQYTNTFGEFETRLALVQHVRNDELARRAATGVDGDRYMVVATPKGQALVWVSVWDTEAEAADFQSAMTTAARRRYGVAETDAAGSAGLPGPVRRVEVPATGERPARTVTLQLEQVGGRAVVIYTDLPAGQPVPIDLRRITLDVAPSGR